MATDETSEETQEATTGGTHPLGSAQTVPARPRASTGRVRIGRYRIVKRLGAGGMGEVWQATDPELGREVAIKLLHAGEIKVQLADRLRREAQALAKLDHPNVVTVHDVGVDDDGDLYIVMQLVSGTTLDRALVGKTRREIVGLLVQAGRGLAAAHAAGIVHRDFKPGNVLVDNTGHVRVSDFGLARASDASDEAGDSANGALGMSMTRGELVGTPAYMAPEQLRGGPVTHATDQFAFCVTLWEALSGARPFAGKDVAALRDAVIKGPPKEPPASIPRRLRGLLVRGLQTSPDARYPSMDALLVDLAPSNRALWALGGVGVAALATTTVLLGVTRPDGGDPCRGVEEPIDAVWGDAQRTAVRASLGTVAPPVITMLDDRTVRWRATRLDACQASHVAAEPQTLDERDQRYACLDQALIDQRAAVALLATKPDGRVVSRAFQVATSGRDPSTCSRKYAADRVKSGKPKGLDPALTIEVAAAVALRDAGHTKEFLALREKLEPRVIASGDQEAIAEWFYGIGMALREFDDSQKTRDPIRRAAEAALAARRDDLAAHAWAELAVMTSHAGDLEGAQNLLVMARGAAGRQDNPIVPIWVELAEGQVSTERGDYDKAIASCTHALEAARSLGDELNYLMEGTGCVFDAQMDKGDGAAALATQKRRYDRAVALYGLDSQVAIEMHRGFASAYAQAGDTLNSIAEWKLALDGLAKNYGEDSPELMWTLKDYALAQTPQGTMSTPEAMAAIEKAIAIGEKILEPDDHQRAQLYDTKGYVLAALKKLDEAIEAYDRAIAIYEKRDDPMALARTLFNSADALKLQQKCDRALPRYERAAKAAAGTGQASLIEANALYGRGTCLGFAKQWAEADAALRLAIEQLDKLQAPLWAAQARWELGYQLRLRGKRADGDVVAKAAIAQLANAPPPADALAKQIADWIKEP